MFGLKKCSVTEKNYAIVGNGRVWIGHFLWLGISLFRIELWYFVQLLWIPTLFRDRSLADSPLGDAWFNEFAWLEFRNLAGALIHILEIDLKVGPD